MKRIITIEAVKEAVEAAHAHFREEKGGKNADYIPYLKNVPSDLFGISVCLADGRSVTVGDTDYRFGIESVSKVPTAILAAACLVMGLFPQWLLDVIGKAVGL